MIKCYEFYDETKDFVHSEFSDVSRLKVNNLLSRTHNYLNSQVLGAAEPFMTNIEFSQYFGSIASMDSAGDLLRFQAGTPSQPSQYVIRTNGGWSFSHDCVPIQTAIQAMEKKNEKQKRMKDLLDTMKSAEYVMKNNDVRTILDQIGGAFKELGI